LKTLVQNYFQELDLNGDLSGQNVLCGFDIRLNPVKLFRVGGNHHQTHLRLHHNTGLLAIAAAHAGQESATGLLFAGLAHGHNIFNGFLNISPEVGFGAGTDLPAAASTTTATDAGRASAKAGTSAKTTTKTTTAEATRTAAQA